MTDPRELIDAYANGYHNNGVSLEPRETCAPAAFAALRAVLDLCDSRGTELLPVNTLEDAIAKALEWR